MPYTLTLSPAAVDLLLAELGLGRAPVPFVVPHIGITGEERAAVRDAVFRDLDSRGLLRRGTIDDDVQIALATFAQPGLAVSAAAKLGDEQLFARVASNGQFAVLVCQRDGMFAFEEVRPTGIVPAIVDLLPLTPAAPGQSVTVARPSKQPVRGDAYDPFAGVSGPRTHNPQLRAVQRIFEKPRLAVGQFTPHVRDGNGQERALPSLAWFDTELGRYLLSTRDSSDGNRWLTYAPADNARLAQQLFTQLEGYSANA
ncbi:ESX secretion-associated protein EspG [Amycolatopsis orientalis]|uniref:ESX secretion-associated protein EspG n=1 Tax=Amycolatopsis orientalis TaxID=31958 RepID=UPI0003A99B9D|nr:ESX secretion-associated protein EspG [Amycolatopsis orientalis]